MFKNELKSILNRSFKKKKKIKLKRKDKDKLVTIYNGFDWTTFAFAFVGLAFVPSLVRKDFLISLIIGTIQYIFIMPFIIYALGAKTLLPIVELLILVSNLFIIYRCKVNGRNRIKRLKANGYVEIQ